MISVSANEHDERANC